MEYIRKVCNEELVYEVTYDEDQLRSLLDDIVKKIYYTKEGTYKIYTGCEEYYEIPHIDGTTLPNGDCMFINVKSVKPSFFTDEPLYYAEILGDKIYVPRLAEIIKSILDGSSYALDELKEYAGSVELIPIKDRIIDFSKRIDLISNYEYEIKIDGLKRLRELCDMEDNHHYFNIKDLLEAYKKTFSLLKVQLVSIKVVEEGKTESFFRFNSDVKQKNKN